MTFNLPSGLFGDFISILNFYLLDFIKKIYVNMTELLRLGANTVAVSVMNSMETLPDLSD